MKLYLVRHGKTEYNINGLIQGNIDVPLSNEGIEDIKKFKDKIDKLNIDICICSPFIRARDTAKILIGDRCKIITNDYLKERYVGKLEGKPVSSYDINKYWDINYEKDDLGVETPKEVLNRAKLFLDYLKDNYKDKSILVVSHAGITKALHYNIVGYDNNTDLKEFYCKHYEIYEYEL